MLNSATVPLLESEAEEGAFTITNPNPQLPDCAEEQPTPGRTVL
jgi:hypothetical protein